MRSLYQRKPIPFGPLNSRLAGSLISLSAHTLPHGQAKIISGRKPGADPWTIRRLHSAMPLLRGGQVAGRHDDPPLRGQQPALQLQAHFCGIRQHQPVAQHRQQRPASSASSTCCPTSGLRARTCSSCARMTSRRCDACADQAGHNLRPISRDSGTYSLAMPAVVATSHAPESTSSGFNVAKPNSG